VNSASLKVLCPSSALAVAAVGQEEPTPVCDVLGTVACFRDLSHGPKPKSIVIDVEAELRQPCTYVHFHLGHLIMVIMKSRA
jgi:hypothetical protein